MFKHKKTDIYSKIKTKTSSCFRCCFYCCYEPLWLLFYCFFHNLLYIGVFNLSLYNERFLLSPCRLLALYKPNILIQY